MMTLEEAIKHCKDVALSCTNKECALEHFQLSKWLQEYSNMLEKQGKQSLVWSEEDEQYFNFLEKLLVILQAKSTENEIKKGTNSNSEYYYKVIQWLKSLRPQHRWKPSDEQMKAIEHICDGNYKVDLDILDSIYRDFKKLREE